ncbi:Hypoxic response protein 1 [Thalassocella blandensis]|nr:Hypoxic response protein 1 [Thalassocella blandensis]
MVSEIGDIQNFLSHHPLFKHLPLSLIEDASNAIYVAFDKAGANLDIFSNEKDFDTGLIIVKTGSLELRSPDGSLQDKLSAGDYLICAELVEEERPAIRSLEDSLYYELTSPAYSRLLSLSPEFAQRCQNHLQTMLSEHLLSIETQQPALRSNERAIKNATESEEGHSFLLHRYVRDHMSTQLVFVEPDTTIQQAAQLMRDHNVTSLLVRAHENNETLVGIVTDRDFRTRVLAEGKSVDESLQHVMTRDPITIAESSLLYEAQTKMMTSGIHHLPVLRDAEIVGIITVSDIFRINNVEPLSLNKAIIAAKSVADLKKTSDKIPDLLVTLAERDTRPSEIGEIITLLYDGITKKLIALAEKNFGAAPCAFAWLGFGSQARKEQVIGSDQDNALIIARPLSAEEALYFSRLSHFVCDGLNSCGIPYCNGGIMASNDKWRQPLEQWKSYFSTWVEERSPKAIMHASIFFDMRLISGDTSLAENLQHFVLNQAQTNTIFLALMSGNALQHSPPLGFFKNFVLENDGGHINTLDLKKRGTIPIVDIARNYALANSIKEVNTVARLNKLKETNGMSSDFATSLIDAHEFIAGLRIESQAKQHKQHSQVTNYLDPASLSPLLRRQLKSAFNFVKQAQTSMKAKFGSGYI